MSIWSWISASVGFDFKLDSAMTYLLGLLSFLSGLLLTEGSAFLESVTSPNFHGTYPAATFTRRQVHASSNSMRLKLLVSNIRITEGDTLIIYDGATCDGDNSVRRYTSSLSGVDPVFISGQHACVELLGNFGGGIYNISAYEMPICKGEMTANSGDIVSPLYPKIYPDNLHCTWVITVKKGQSVMLTIQDIDLEKSGDDCFDKLKLSSLKNKDVTLCGSTAVGKSYYTKSSKATVEFIVPDRWLYSIKSRGFRLSYKAQGCPEPIMVTDNSGSAREVSTVYEPGHRLHYVCPEGQIYRSGAKVKVSVCQENNQWDSWSDSCVDVTCSLPSLGPGLKASENVERFSIGSFVQFTCSSGLDLLGNEAVECMNDGQWNASLPFCKDKNRQETCYLPPEIAHGHLLNVSLMEGGLAIYECEKKYKMVGLAEMTCQKEGTWSGQLPVCELIRCPELAVSAGSNLILDQSENRTVGSRVWYSCEAGFEIIGGILRTRVCRLDGNWDGQEPVCIERHCPKPDQPLHGTADYRTLAVGDLVKFACLSDYELDGPESAVCLESGLWSADPPACIDKSTFPDVSNRSDSAFTTPAGSTSFSTLPGDHSGFDARVNYSQDNTGRNAGLGVGGLLLLIIIVVVVVYVIVKKRQANQEPQMEDVEKEFDNPIYNVSSEKLEGKGWNENAVYADVDSVLTDRPESVAIENDYDTLPSVNTFK